ncbi:hypothetical protein F511_20519 [Dorcoceras hygrometricum]|uniref:Uncharacterized protein n=1 Tax=Dorcoceras hygrometricum TaxID=472368 RepID=A0A2Z7CH05_9LAMI|nr:hypothetical protein F511_20519 [Dorcoceras hygrometricum]
MVTTKRSSRFYGWAMKDRIARQCINWQIISVSLYPHGVSTGEIIGTTHQSVSHNVASNQVINQSVNQAQDATSFLRASSTMAEYFQELKSISSKLTNEQPDQISQESSNEQQLCASSSIRSIATNKVAIEKGTLKEPSAT